MKGHTGKKAINRHQKQSKISASNQKRAIENKEIMQFEKDYRKAQRAVDMLGGKFHRREVWGDKVILSGEECEDTKALIRMFCLLRKKAFDEWLKTSGG